MLGEIAVSLTPPSSWRTTAYRPEVRSLSEECEDRHAVVPGQAKGITLAVVMACVIVA